MQLNLPVFDEEFDFPEHELLMSTTDTRGVITHCNQAFVRVSGYSAAELLGAPHNILRHPDVPPEAFKDMWATIGRGRNWRGIVKNRRKDGRYYWVAASVTPLTEGGKIIGYVSIRGKPTRAQVAAAWGLYQKIHAQREAGRDDITLHGGRVRTKGLSNRIGMLQRANFSQRFAALGVPAVAATLGLHWLGANGTISSAAALAGVGAATLLGFGGLMLWVHRQVSQPIEQAMTMTERLAAAVVDGTFPNVPGRHPSAILLERLEQLRVALRSVVGDARDEIQNFKSISETIAKDSAILTDHADVQIVDLQRTNSAVSRLSATVEQSMQTLAEVRQRTQHATQLAHDGRQAMHEADHTVQGMTEQARQMEQIIVSIENIAFQTSILALNAAVEAARAGERGRGFTVVASEVRALAQRSAQAAAEIRSLIAASATQIRTSAQHMHSASDRIDEMVVAIERVHALVGDIGQTFEDQRHNIERVIEALSTMEGAGADNKSFASEAGAAASHLNLRTGRLWRTLAVFRI